MSIHFHECFLEYLPRLLTDATFRDEIIKKLGKEGPEVLARVQNNLPIDDEDQLFDTARNAYSNCAENVLTLVGWRFSGRLGGPLALLLRWSLRHQFKRLR